MIILLILIIVGATTFPRTVVFYQRLLNSECVYVPTPVEESADSNKDIGSSQTERSECLFGSEVSYRILTQDK